MDCIAIQSLGHDTALGRGVRRPVGGAGRRWGARGGRLAGRTAWARCWPTGCALGALSLFLARFDLVLFLSQFLDIVREPGS